ncbi:MAG TPA: hypothetical protein VEW25_09465 [Allosphingosinicella sp.]|nr:hypothetical protein [Allosphingosinicella sp.]
MSSRLTYSTLGGAVFVAAAVGVLLGESAIDQINPLYFQGAAAHPRDRGAVVDETEIDQLGPRFADHYGWEDGQAARVADCQGCPAVAARDAYLHGAQFAVAETGWGAEAQPVADYYSEQPPTAATEPEHKASAAEPSELDRYASFQVEEKPAATEPVEVAAAADD